METLHPVEAIFPEDAQVFNALGAALSAEKVFTAEQVEADLEKLRNMESHEVQRLRPLFENAEELAAFRARHAKTEIPFADIKLHKGPCFLGIDAVPPPPKLRSSTPRAACSIRGTVPTAATRSKRSRAYSKRYIRSCPTRRI